MTPACSPTPSSKGGDRLLHAALCGELGLKGRVRPLHFAKSGWQVFKWPANDEGDPIERDALLEDVFVGHEFQWDSKHISGFYLEGTTTAREMQRLGFINALYAADVWIGLRKRAHELFTLRTSCIAYGNDPTTTIVYSGVALLLEVPAWDTPERVRAMAAAV